MSDTPKADKAADSGLRLTSCSPSSLTPETDAEHEVAKSCGFPLMVQADFARKLERERDEARRLHAYANAQRKAANTDRLNAEETVDRLRLRVDQLLKHEMTACEYTDGWDDALLKVRSELSPENKELSHP